MERDAETPQVDSPDPGGDAPRPAAPVSPVLTTTSPGERVQADKESLLISFLQERDVACPRCKYNLRNLTRPVCPECEEPLSLHVKAEQFSIAPLLATLAPSMFTGLLTAIVLIIAAFSGGLNDIPAELAGFLLFGVISGVGGLILAANNRAFMRLKVEYQSGFAMLSWLGHVIFFVVFFGSL